MTRIDMIGSKWAGQADDTVDDLLALMALEPLDPRFEAYGNFLCLIHETSDHGLPHPDNGAMRLWGNFLTCSYVFGITTTDPDLIHRAYRAIVANQASPAYLAERNRRA